CHFDVALNLNHCPAPVDSRHVELHFRAIGHFSLDIVVIPPFADLVLRCQKLHFGPHCLRSLEHLCRHCLETSCLLSRGIDAFSCCVVRRAARCKQEAEQQHECRTVSACLGHEGSPQVLRLRLVGRKPVTAARGRMHLRPSGFAPRQPTPC